MRGVNYRMPPIAKDVRAVAYVEHLRKDLSQTQLVLDSELRRVLSELGQLRMRMCPA